MQYKVKHAIFIGKTAIIMAAAMGYMLLSGASEARAYLNCEAVSGRATAQIDGRAVTLRNTSSQCVHVGVAVYIISGASGGRAFYYSNETPLAGGSLHTFNVPVPRCNSYAIDAIVGKPLRDAVSSSGYGSRLLLERIGSTYGGECSGVQKGSQAANSTLGTAIQTDHGISYVYADSAAPATTPKPLPRSISYAKAIPTPAPKAPLPQPKPKVLGAQTGSASTSSLAVSTGSAPHMPVILLGAIALSAILWLLFRRKPDIIVLI